jgi:hypothetical protein
MVVADREHHTDERSLSEAEQVHERGQGLLSRPCLKGKASFMRPFNPPVTGLAPLAGAGCDQGGIDLGVIRLGG